MSWEVIWNGFMYTVIDKWDWTVEKIPRKAWNTSSEKEKSSFELHKKYLWDLIVPDTDIFIPKKKIISSSDNFEVYQDKIIRWNPVDLINTTNEKVIELLASWSEMQKDNKVLFDVFWLEWMVQLFEHYFKWTPIKSFNDLFLPANAKYLKIMHNFPLWLLEEMHLKELNPFIAYNILEDEKWDIHFIDTDYRPLDVFHPLNHIWNWITQKALRDVKKHRYLIENAKRT